MMERGGDGIIAKVCEFASLGMIVFRGHWRAREGVEAGVVEFLERRGDKFARFCLSVVRKEGPFVLFFL